jgi:rod shape-determining protein MreC
MALPDIRLRAGYLYLVVAVGHIILISAQVNSRPGVPLLEAAVFGVVAEVQRVASGGIGAVASVWHDYAALRSAARENADLRRRVTTLQVKLQEEKTRSELAARLQALLDLRDQSNLSMATAAVIAGSATPDLRTVFINKGSHDGILKDMAALTSSGVVGRVVRATWHAARVQLLIDRNAAAAALVARSREQGMIVGTGEDYLRMDYVSSTADVKIGDIVLTSGIDGIYPKGFVIGQVESVERAGGMYKTIRVRPAVNFGTLEEILIVTTPVPGPGREAPQ